MSGTTHNTILEQLAGLLGSVTPVMHVASSRVKRDTLEDARGKTAKKLRDNKAYFTGAEMVEKIDPVFKRQADGRFSIGVKYGNRFLKGAVGGGTFVPNVKQDKAEQVLEMLAAQVEAGLYDAAIEKVMDANVAARNSVKH